LQSGLREAYPAFSVLSIKWIKSSQVAMMGKLPYTALRDSTFTHPTLAEGLNYLFMTLDS
jgi:hypothetical protein